MYLLDMTRLQASPEFKGIKTHNVGIYRACWLQASPEFKGIKTLALTCELWHRTGSKPALNSKGLRHSDVQRGAAHNGLQASPEFKGIKTGYGLRHLRGNIRSKPALNSKGLRHVVRQLVRLRVFAPSQP